MIQKGIIIGLAFSLATFLGCGNDNGSAGSDGTGGARDEAGTNDGTNGADHEATDTGEYISDAGGEAGTEGNDNDAIDSGEDAAEAPTHPLVDIAEPLPECPEGTECMSPAGNTWCGSAETHLPPRCDTDDDCDFGICVPSDGHGWCAQFCEPPGGFPEEVSITGKVVEYIPFVEFEFPVIEYLTEDQPAIEGARVCVYDDNDIPCVKSGADGVFKLEGISNDLMNIYLSVTKDGYQPVLRYLMGGTQRDRTLETVAPLYTKEQFEQWAINAGADYLEKNTGAIFTGAVKLRTGGEDSPFTVSWDGGGDYVYTDGFTVVLEPKSGIGPLYLDAEEAPDSSLNAASIRGMAAFFNLEPGDYTLHFTHPDSDCGEPIPITVAAGFVTTWRGGGCFPSEE